MFTLKMFSFLRQRKTLIFVFFFFIFFLLLTAGAKVAYAACTNSVAVHCICDDNTRTCIASSNLPVSVMGMAGVVWENLFVATCYADSDCRDSNASSFYRTDKLNTVLDAPALIVLGAGQAILRGADEIAKLFSSLLQSILSNVVTKSITKNPDYADAWKFVRDLANMIIVLGFVVVGIATALRIQSYAAKQLLMKLVFVAVIVNFSGLFCGLMIDAANITMTGLGSSDTPAGISGTGPAGVPASLLGAVKKVIKVETDKTVNNFSEASAAAGKCILYALVYLGMALTFLYLSVILLARFAILLFLFILSPLAFAFWIYPATEKWFSQWWENFLKWSFVGVFGFFVLKMATVIIKAQPALDPATKEPHSLINTILPFAVVLIFLFVGFKMTSGSTGLAAKVAGGAVGLAKAGAGMAVTGAVLGAGGLAKMAGKTRAGAWVSDKAQGVSGRVGRIMERAGLKDQGSTDLKQAGKTKETAERMSAQINAGGLDQVQRTSRGEGMDKSSKARAGATAALLKTGNFEINGADGKPDQKQIQALAHFQAMGGDLSEHSKKDPRLAAYDINARAKTMKENPGMSEAAANEKNVASAYSKLGPKGLEGLSTGAIDENAFRYIKPQTTEKAVDLGNLTDKQQDSMLKYISSDASGPNTPESKRLYDLEKNLRATGKTDEADRIRDNVAAVKKLRGDRVPSKKESEKSPAKNSGLIDRTPDINAPESHDASKFKFKKK